MQDVFHAGTLVAATVTTGLVAGLLYAFACSVMPGLRRSDERTFVDAFQQLDQAIMNPLFLVIFVGAPGFSALALLLSLGEDRRPVLPWMVAALALNLATVMITRAVHLPLNAAIQAAGKPDEIQDLEKVRAGMLPRWSQWNVVRTVTSTGALGCLAWALVEYGRLGN